MIRHFSLFPVLLAGLVWLGLNNSVIAQDWAKLKGQVTLKKGQEIPKAEKIDVTKDKEVCLAKGALYSDAWLVNEKNRGIKNVFVWLEPAIPGQPMKIHPSLKNPKPKTHVLDQPCCMFDPSCFVLRQGDILLVKNPAPIVHNFRWVGLKNNGNINMPPKTDFKIDNLVEDRIPNQLKCDVHPWMTGWLRVFDHPYFALTDENGNFEIPNAPQGNYRLKIWHPASGWLGGQAGRMGIPLRIPASGTVEVKNKGKALEIEAK